MDQSFLQVVKPDYLFWKLSSWTHFPQIVLPDHLLMCTPYMYVPFFANCHGWNPVSGSPFLQIDVPDTFVMELHLSEGTLF